MSAEAEGTAPAAQPAGLSGTPGTSGVATALARVENWHHDVVAQVDGWGWIRTLNDQLTAVLAPWRERYQGNPVLELMHGGRWLGHPLHPALSDLPIGFWADLCSWTSSTATRPRRRPRPGGRVHRGRPRGRGRDRGHRRGRLDRQRRPGPPGRAVPRGAQHGRLGLQGMSLAARLAGHRGTARGLGAAGLAVTGAAAYLGGHLVFAKAVMVSRVAGADGPRRWVRVIEEAELPGRRAHRRAGRRTADPAVPARRNPLRPRQPLQPRRPACSAAASVQGLTVTCPLHGRSTAWPTAPSGAARHISRSP
jgi:hypothetical protein